MTDWLPEKVEEAIRTDEEAHTAFGELDEHDPAYHSRYEEAAQRSRELYAAIQEALDAVSSTQPKYPDFNSLVVTCPHGAVWCGVCIIEKTAWYGAQR